MNALSAIRFGVRDVKAHGLTQANIKAAVEYTLPAPSTGDTISVYHAPSRASQSTTYTRTGADLTESPCELGKGGKSFTAFTLEGPNEDAQAETLLAYIKRNHPGEEAWDVREEELVLERA